MNQPFEGSPGRVHLDGLFQALIMGNLDIGIAPADMREHGTVFVFQRAEQIAGRGGIGINVGQVIDQCMRGTVYLPSLVHVQDIAVAAKPGIAGPFPAGKHDETIILGKFHGKLVEPLPEFIGDLEVVALVYADIEKRLVAREIVEITRRISADGFLRLAMQVAPVRQQLGAVDDSASIPLALHNALPFYNINDQITVSRGLHIVYMLRTLPIHQT